MISIYRLIANTVLGLVAVASFLLLENGWRKEHSLQFIVGLCGVILIAILYGPLQDVLRNDSAQGHSRRDDAGKASNGRCCP